MSVMTSTQFRDVVEPLLNKVFDGIYKMLPSEWDKIFLIEQALPRAFQEVPYLVGMAPGQVKSSGSTVVYDEGTVAWRARFVHTVYALAFALTQELMEDGEHISMAKTYSEHLARSMAEAKELVHAAIFNNAFSSSYPIADGGALLQASHPQAFGGTYSNILATPANLSVAALEQLNIQIETATDDRGKFINLHGKKLITAPANKYVAKKILRSTLVPFTADNTANILADEDMPWQRLTRLTNSKAWFVQTDAPKGLVHYVRAKLVTSSEGDFETSNMRYKARERYSAGPVDPRGLYGSQGV
jgi:hypothetical protein